jgi:tetratricopeptide (TPR) repeat protein
MAARTQGVAAVERAVDLYRRLGDGRGLGHSLAELGGMLAINGRHEQATVILAEAFALLEHAGMGKALALCFEGLGFLKLFAGDVTNARMYFEKALALHRSAGAESAVLATLINLAESTWALGDLDAALAGLREVVALLRKSPLVRKTVMAQALINLAGVHTERGELAEALAAAREGLPLCEEAGYAWSSLDHLALRAALVGKVADAARLIGFVDSTYKAKETSRQPNEARAYARLQTLLRERLDPGQLTRLLAEGATMSEDEACRLALEE